MTGQIELMRKLAMGEIENPSLTLTVNGQSMTIAGEETKFFAIGYLTGAKNAPVENNTSEVSVH